MANFEDYSPSNVDPFVIANSDQRETVIQESVEQLAGLSEQGQQFSAIYANRTLSPSGDSPTFVRLNSLFGSSANADQQFIACQYVGAFPNSSYLALDLPAHGASDVLTKEQRKAIKTSGGSMRTVASAQVEAALDIVPDLDNIVVTGEGAGEFMAVEFAAQAAAKGIKVKQLFGFDPLGLESRTPLSLAAGYLGSAQRSRNQRRHDADRAGEQRLEDAFSKDFVPAIEKYGPIKAATQAGHVGLLARERTITRLMFRQSPISRGTGLRALEGLLLENPELQARLVFAGQSAVGRLTEPVQEALTEINEDSGGRLHVDEWPYDNQDIGLARHHPRLIKYIQDHLGI